MPRQILLVEPNYKNKYPPMALMKLSTYFKLRGDNVRFFKGDLKELAAEIIVDELLEQLTMLDDSVDWKQHKKILIDFVLKGKKEILENIEDFTEVPFACSLIQDARRDYKNKKYFKYTTYDKVCIMTLFTFYWEITIDTINFVKQLCKTQEGVVVGGIMSTLLPNEVFKATGIYPVVGLLNKKGDIDPDNDRIIDSLPLDYSILDEVDYVYPANNAYYAYMTRGCINRCSFCAVPKLEPEYLDYIPLKENIDEAREKYGEQRNLLLLDNNVLASKYFNKIIDEIKECGFAKGAHYIPPNEYEIAIRNLKNGINDRAYIKKCINLYKKLLSKLDAEKGADIYLMLEKKHMLDIYTVTKEDILEIDGVIAPLYKKCFTYHKPLKRIVDFNQGIDSRLISDENMSKLSEVNIEPLRIAFDHWELRDVYEKSVRTAVKHGIRNLSNYLLYNFQDKPEDLYYRLKMNVELCEELDASIYSFPMKYHPINDPDFFMNRDYIGTHWNRKFIRAVQAVLNSTKGGIGKGLTFFYEAFGKDVDRFFTILWMPEVFIVYRFMFKDNLAQQWEEKFKALSEENRALVKKVVSTNVFTASEWSNYDDSVKEVLMYYTITRKDVPIFKEKFKMSSL